MMREVSDSIHLRRFCLIALGERVPDESTVRKLTRRLGGEVVNELTRCVIAKAQRETRFRARAVRIDSTVVEADVRLSERCWADAGWRQNAGARGQEADGGGRGGRRTSAGSHARNRAPSANDLQDDGQKDRRAQVGGPAADRGGRSTAPAVAAGSETSGWQGAPRRAGSWREREARCGQATARDDRPSRASRGADRASPGWQADSRPAHLDIRPGRSSDPQGQAGQAEPVPIARLSRGRPRAGALCLDLPGFLGVRRAAVSA